MSIIKRPIVVILTGTIIGIIYGLYLEISIAFSIIFLLVLIYLIQKNKRKMFFIFYKRKRLILTILISIMVAFIYLIISNNHFKRIYDTTENIQAFAYIISNQKETEYYYSYEAKIDRKKYIIYVEKNKFPRLEYGMYTIIEGRYIEPQERRNYNGFNYKEYLKTKKIYGSIKIDNITIVRKNELNPILTISNQVREKIIETINTILPDDTAGVLKDILVGDDLQLTEDIELTFRKSSLSHILAISGTHVSFIMLGITWILLRLKIPKRVSYLLACLLLMFFIFITGCSISVIRASVMSIIMILSKIFYRKFDILNSMSITLLIILVYNPFSINDVSLQLSYLGVLGIVLFNKPISTFLNQKINKRIASIISVTISAQILIMPIIVMKFNSISTIFILSNIVAIPLMGIVVLLGYSTVLVGFISIKFAVVIGKVLDIIINLLILSAKILGDISFSSVTVVTPSAVLVFVYYVSIYLFLINKKIYKKLLIVTFVYMIIVTFLPHNLTIHFIDVGQGDCTVIKTPHNKTIVIDTGEVDNVVVEYLLDRRIKKIDYLMISHFDSDHCNKATEILEKLKVKNLIISKQPEKSEEFERIIKEAISKKINIIEVKAGDKITIEKNIYIEIIWPEGSKQIKESPLNNNSIVAKLRYNNFSMLFTGDIERIAENYILNRYKDNVQILKCDLLKVAHHGSITSTTDNFLEVTKPYAVLIGVGQDNKFGHPNSEILQRITNLRYQNLQDRLKW